MAGTNTVSAAPDHTSSTAAIAAPTAVSAAWKLWGLIEVSPSMRTMPVSGVAARMRATYSAGCANSTAASSAKGACLRSRPANASASRVRAIAFSRSGRSGWPGGVMCSR
jgi:hypothetical protein